VIRTTEPIKSSGEKCPKLRTGGVDGRRCRAAALWQAFVVCGPISVAAHCGDAAAETHGGLVNFRFQAAVKGRRDRVRILETQHLSCASNNPEEDMGDRVHRAKLAASRLPLPMQDFLIVSSFGMWSLLLGLSPALAYNAFAWG
jgi:hypothetical protein